MDLTPENSVSREKKVTIVSPAGAAGPQSSDSSEPLLSWLIAPAPRA